MKEFTYSLFYRLLYRFGNIPLTFLLILLLAPLIVEVNKKIILLLPVVISFLMIYFLNKGYLQFYKILPFRIVVNGDRMVCKNFLFSKKEIEFRFSDIVSLEGGIFSGRMYGIMKIKTENNFTVGFFNTIKNARELETIILQNVKRSVYDEVAGRISQIEKPMVKEEKK